MALPGSSPKFHVLLLVTLVLSLCIPSFGQSELATVSGTITDPTGAAVTGAQVKLTNVNTGITAATPSNETGLYVFPVVRPGQYRMVVEKQGFRQIVLTDLTVNVQDALSRNFKLQLGVVGESVTVTGDVNKVNTQDASVSTVVDSQFVENMPLNGRSFQSLIYMTPGVVITSADFYGLGQFSTNGQRTDTNYFTIDGVSANFGGTPSGGVASTLGGTSPALTSGGGTNGMVSVDAMQEFRIQTSSYAPEFGRSPGAQIAIATKSGTNRWHGTASEYLRNDVFDARNYFNNAGPSQDIFGNPIPAEAKPPLRQNDFGGTVSGPLWKDRTFFFFSYEGLRLREPNSLEGYFFSSDAKAAVTAANSAWEPIINATPTATGALFDPTCDNVTNPCLRELNAGYSNPSSFNAYSLRLDQKLTNKINLFARYSHTPSNSDSLQGLSSNFITYANTDTATLGVTATITPTLVNDFRGNWSRQVSGGTYALAANYGAVAPSASEVTPPGFKGTLRYDFLFPGLSADYALGSFYGQTQHQLNFVDTLSKTVGAHQLKFGVDYRRITPFEDPGTEVAGLPFSWASFLGGYMDLAFNITGVPLTIHDDNWSFFGQDTWRVRPHLTLTYGLRWDINTPPVSNTAGKPLYTLDGIFNSNPLALVQKPLWNTYYGAFAPRIGAAYQMNSKTTLRAGFGLFYDLGYGTMVSGAFSQLPYFGEKVFFGVNVNDFTNPAYQPLTLTTDVSQLAGSAFKNLTSVDPNLKLPLTYQWNVAVERELGKAQTLTVTYVGAYAHNLLYAALVQLPPQDYGILDTATLNSGSSRYNALQVQFMRRMSHGLQAMVSYSYSHSNDTVSNDYTALGASFTGISALKPPPLTPSDFDFHQTFKGMVSYETPKPAWGGKAGKAAFGGWALDGILQAQSAPPLTIVVQETDPVLGFVNAIAADVPGQPIWIHDATEPAGKALNPAAFSVSADGSSALGLRNSIRSPYGILQTDMALRRRFNITERVKLDFRAEYFNLFNHPMFGGSGAPTTNLGECFSNTAATCTAASGNWLPDASFGKVYNTGGGSGSTLNVGLGSQSPLYAPGGNRSGQLTLRLTF
ncbi:MAG: TonB-dependent receptor domain-containing protein [Terriglobales bacterium]